MDNMKQITEFTFWDFLQGVEQAIKEGYTFLNTNEGFPQATVGLYTCIMVKKEKEVAPVEPKQTVEPTPVVPEVKEVVKLTVPPATKGRKSKN